MLHHTRVPDRAHGQMCRIDARFFRARARRSPYLGIVTFTFDAWSTVGESNGMVTALQRALQLYSAAIYAHRIKSGAVRLACPLCKLVSRLQSSLRDLCTG